MLPVLVIALRRIEPAVSTGWLPMSCLLIVALLVHTTLSRRREGVIPLPAQTEEDEYFQRLGI